MEAVDDRTFRFRLKQPFPKLLFALGKCSTPCAFIMPERIATTDPFKQIGDYVGSGPMTFRKDEWVPGAARGVRTFRRLPAARRKVRLAVRRQADQFRPHRVEDPAGRRHRLGARCSRVRSTGGKSPIPDLVPLLKKNANLLVDIADPARQYRRPPDEPSASAVQRPAGAAGGADRHQPGRLHAGRRRRRHEAVEGSASFFTPGTPLYTDHGGDNLKRHEIEAARKLRRRSRPQGHQGGAGGRHRCAHHQGARRRDRRHAEEDRHERRICRDRLGHGRRSAAPARSRSTRAAGTSSTPGTPAPTA